MANHKRRGPKSTRSGCLLCKPHKHQAESRLTRQELKAQIDEAEGREDAEGLKDNKCKGSGYPVSLHLLQLGHTHNPCGHCGRRVKILKNGRMASHR